jgi:hypothetical protein
MFTKPNINTAAWGAALVRSIAYSPWLLFTIPPANTPGARRERSGA